ncbi:MAG: T9SS type A sorting domain-containing protein [Bacteroidetes bacterium]|nr:T9SS type A sorting domain-containing protein [Bacteroidota bacterium]
MELYNEPNVKPEHKLLKLVIVSSIIVILLGGIFFLISNLLPSKKSAAHSSPKVHYCKGSIMSSTNKKVFSSCVNGDTIKVTQGLNINQGCDKLKDKDILFLIDGCEAKWNGNYSFYVGKGGKVFLKNGGKLTVKSGSCNSNAAIYFGTTKFVTCDGQTASFSFDQVNNYGGVSFAGLTVLPVKLISFTAKYNKEIVNLEWATASEVNNSHFEVQRSLNKSDWTVVGTVKGNGNSSSIIKYSFDDKVGKMTGEIYYRLKQVDFDGKNELSNVRVVSLNNTKINIGKVYPNPANDIVKVNINTDGDYNIILQDINGKELLKQEGSSSIETINVSEFPAGIYFVKIQNDEINESHRILIRH